MSSSRLGSIRPPRALLSMIELMTSSLIGLPSNFHTHTHSLTLTHTHTHTHTYTLSHTHTHTHTHTHHTHSNTHTHTQIPIPTTNDIATSPGSFSSLPTNPRDWMVVDALPEHIDQWQPNALYIIADKAAVQDLPDDLYPNCMFVPIEVSEH